MAKKKITALEIKLVDIYRPTEGASFALVALDADGNEVKHLGIFALDEKYDRLRIELNDRFWA